MKILTINYNPEDNEFSIDRVDYVEVGDGEDYIFEGDQVVTLNRKNIGGFDTQIMSCHFTESERIDQIFQCL